MHQVGFYYTEISQLWLR